MLEIFELRAATWADKCYVEGLHGGSITEII